MQIMWHGAWRALEHQQQTNTQTSGAMTANSVSLDGVLQSAYTPSGSPSTYPKKMSIGTKQGFSIVQFEGNATNRTVPHGLGKPAKFMIVKNMDTAIQLVGQYIMMLLVQQKLIIILRFQMDLQVKTDTAFQDTAPTSDVFYLVSKAANNDTDDTIAFIWADVPENDEYRNLAYMSEMKIQVVMDRS